MPVAAMRGITDLTPTVDRHVAALLAMTIPCASVADDHAMTSDRRVDYATINERHMSKRDLSMKLGWQPQKWLQKKAKGGFRGYPMGTVAFYGPDNERATKMVVTVFMAQSDEPDEMRKWFVDTGDVRTDATITAEAVSFLRDHGVRSVTMLDAIFGCPHEEGIDYPEGGVCPHCAYWAGRDRFTGKLHAS